MIAMLNTFISDLASVASAALALLPSTPFSWNLGSLSSYISTLNFFFPFAAMLAEMELLVPAVLAWYGVRIILRWVKAAGS